MSEVELVAAALAAGATAAFSETVQRGARDAWRGLFDRAGRRRGATAGEEQPATGPAWAVPPAEGSGGDGPTGHHTIVANEIKGVVMGDNARQNNHFH
ncbi:hypothetical protein [Streptomyces sp. NPDC049040]|uniref:hypothetical protein n=1 Tax=Streptomyces sp. NPDC049040 TaxID=3365593 RepID=UPI0037233D51